jgi:serine/threonine protein kinase
MMSKKPITDFWGIAAVKQELAVMKILNSEANRHPNIARLHSVYHSETHILFRMEDAGQLDLHKRLVLREHRSLPLPLSVSNVTSILLQCVGALSHLHEQAHVVQQDVKPENIVLNEKEGKITVKLIDFGCARIVDPAQTTCYGKVGTFLFMAPEVVLARRYDPFAADVWSMGMVFCELFCCLNAVKKVVGLDTLRGMDKKARDEFKMQKIVGFFKRSSDAVNMLLQTLAHPTLTPLLEGAQILLEGMLSVPVKGRWTASEIRQRSHGMLAFS